MTAYSEFELHFGAVRVRAHAESNGATRVQMPRFMINRRSATIAYRTRGRTGQRRASDNIVSESTPRRVRVAASSRRTA